MWIRAELLTAGADEVAEAVQRLGASGVEIQDGETYMEGVEFGPVPDGMSRVIAYFDGEEVTEALTASLEGIKEGELVYVGPYSDRSWETAWMDYFKPLRISERVAVGPPWDRAEAPEGGIALTIEPGMAFGTGTHETTRLCASILDEVMAEGSGQTVLDVGCGSAILSMAARGLGATEVVGVDVDATAVEVARENVEKNGFTAQEIRLSTRPVGEIEETFDVVVANILAPILLDLCEDLVARVGPAGVLLLSGIDEERLPRIGAAFPREDLVEERCERDGEWFAVVYRRR